MADKIIKTFIVNDETVVNCYGFRVLNAGIDWSDFDKNPVLLFDHVNSVNNVGGNWQNRQTSGSQILMDANFDTEDPEVNTIAGKVQRGFLKGASLGLAVSWDDAVWRLAPDGNYDLLKCKACEVTVCAVPGNAGALALYNAATGKRITQDEVKLSVEKLSKSDLKINNTQQMEKINLSTDAKAILIGLKVGNVEDIAEISNAIVNLNKRNTELESEVTNLKNAAQEQLKLQAKALADQAVLEEKITQAEHADLVNDAIANYALAAKLVAKLPGKVSLNSKVINSDKATDEKVKTIDDFEKLDTAAKLSWKTENPVKYKALFAK